MATSTIKNYATKSEVDKRAFGYHFSSNAATKTITGANGYQQYLVSILAGSWRTLTMITCVYFNQTIYEDKIFTTDNTKSLNPTYVGNGVFTIDIPNSTQANIMSVESFTVS